jgi:hypothetical protein
MQHVWGRREVRTGFWRGNLSERDQLEDIGVDGRIILKWIFKKLQGDRDWVDLAQDTDRWRTLANAVINHPGSMKCKEFLN